MQVTWTHAWLLVMGMVDVVYVIADVPGDEAMGPYVLNAAIVVATWISAGSSEGSDS